MLQAKSNFILLFILGLLVGSRSAVSETNSSKGMPQSRSAQIVVATTRKAELTLRPALAGWGALRPRFRASFAIATPNSQANLLVQSTKIEVTGIRLNNTASGLRLIIETADGQKIVPLILPEGNDLVIDLTDVDLDLAADRNLRQIDPAPGIASIITTQNDSDVRIVITGEENAPSAEVITGSQNLILSITPEGNTAQTEPDRSIDIIATGQDNDDDDYFVPSATTGTRTDTSILDTPQSIQVIPRKVLDDQQVIRLDEALRNVSGVTFGGTNLGRSLEFTIRGFDTAPVLRNGFRQFEAGGIFPETSNLERVEVLKGPAAVLFGEVQPGGVINLVTKQPLSEPYYDFEAQFGNRGLIRPRIDISGPLTEDGNLKYRLNALYQTNDEIQDFETDIERFFISPVITWNIGKNTDLTVELNYLNEERPPIFGIPAIGDEIADIPFEQITNEPDDVAEEEFLNVGYDFEHRFNDKWKVRNGFRYTKQDSSLEVAFPAAPDEIDPETGIVTRFSAFQPEESESFTLNTSLVGEFATGPIEHKLLFGIDLNRTEDNFNTSTRLDTENPLELNIFAPEFGTFTRPDPEDIPLIQDDETETERLGIFIQDEISLLDNLILLAGVRYDTVDETTTNNPTDFDPSSGEVSQSNDDFSPRVGLVYQPIPEVSLYGSFSESFSPSSEFTADGEFIEPETGRGFEVGVKTELLKGKLATTLAYFNITKENVTFADPDPDSLFAFSASGEQKSQGVELDIIGEILPGWDIVASYAFIDAEVTEDDFIEIGNRLPNAPENSASLSTNYQIQQGTLKGLGLGVGFNFVGEREGDLDNSFKLDDYFLTNAAISYERSGWRAAVNFRNIFDVDFISGASPVRVRGNDPGEPFTVVGSLSLQL